MRVDTAFEFLRRSFASERVANAYLFEGSPRGEAGLLAVRCLSYLYCTAVANRPCGKCAACKQIAAHTHPDMLWVEPQKKSRRISVEAVRDLQKRVFLTSFAGGWKSCVVSGADRLGRESANAFLKTLEEPPGRSIFILLSDAPQFLLPTILSRCQRVSLSGSGDPLPDEARRRVIHILTRFWDGICEGDSDGAGGFPTVASLGAAADMEEFLKEVKNEMIEQEKERAADDAGDEDRETVEARGAARYREFRTGVMRLVLSLYRDILVLCCGGQDDLVTHDKWLTILKKESERLPRRRALRNVAVVEEMDRRLERNMSEGVVLRAGLSDLASGG